MRTCTGRLADFLRQKALIKTLQKEEAALKRELFQGLRATGQDRLEFAEGTVERFIRVSLSLIDPQVLRRAIGKERAPHYIHEEVEVEIVVDEFEPEVVAKVHHTYSEMEFVEATPERSVS